jgi:hypothetical protein
MIEAGSWVLQLLPGNSLSPQYGLSINSPGQLKHVVRSRRLYRLSIQPNSSSSHSCTCPEYLNVNHGSLGILQAQETQSGPQFIVRLGAMSRNSNHLFLAGSFVLLIIFCSVNPTSVLYVCKHYSSVLNSWVVAALSAMIRFAHHGK